MGSAHSYYACYNEALFSWLTALLAHVIAARVRTKFTEEVQAEQTAA